MLPTGTGAETPRKGGKGRTGLGAGVGIHPLAQKQDLLGSTSKYKKYNVIRKQPMSFAPSHQRVLLMDEDYMHILPGGRVRRCLVKGVGRRVGYRLV